MILDFTKDYFVDETVHPQVRVELMQAYVQEATHDPWVRELAFQFASENPRDPAQGILDGQNRVIRYELDCGDGTCEILRSARSTLRLAVGDCKKKSIVTAAMMEIIGIPAMVVWLDQESVGSEANHVAVQTCRRGYPKHGADTAVQIYLPDRAPPCSEGWAWVETTLPGAIIGRDPYSEVKRLGNVMSGQKRKIL